jgi:hypothetical protein
MQEARYVSLIPRTTLHSDSKQNCPTDVLFHWDNLRNGQKYTRLKCY